MHKLLFLDDKCEPNEMKCANKNCVPKQSKCDGNDDCGDNSDEKGCGELICDTVIPTAKSCYYCDIIFVHRGEGCAKVRKIFLVKFIIFFGMAVIGNILENF